MSPIAATRNNFRQFYEGFNAHGDNLGLRLEKINPEICSDDDGNAKHQGKDDTISMMVAFPFGSCKPLRESYSYSMKRWTALQESRSGVCAFFITAETKVLLGTGNANVHEFGFNCNRPWGVPYISGSTLKGLVSSYLARKGGDGWKRDLKNGRKSDLQVELFGGVRMDGDAQSFIGSVIFNDAWMELPKGSVFQEDIINVHHQKYYGGTGMPTGMENPVPVKIAALRAGMRFFISLEGPDENTAFVKKVLALALKEEGLGGKTAVGYGRFTVESTAAEQNAELMESLQGADEAGLLELYHAHEDDHTLNDVFRRALDNFDLSKENDVMMRRLRPLKYLLGKVNNGSIADTQHLSRGQLRTESRAVDHYLDEISVPLNTTKDGQALFDRIMEKIQPDTEFISNNWLLSQIAYTWNDLAPDGDRVMEILDDPDHVWPPMAELEEYIKTGSGISDENRETLLEMLQDTQG